MNRFLRLLFLVVINILCLMFLNYIITTTSLLVLLALNAIGVPAIRIRDFGLYFLIVASLPLFLLLIMLVVG